MILKKEGVLRRMGQANLQFSEVLSDSLGLELINEVLQEKERTKTSKETRKGEQDSGSKSQCPCSREPQGL